MQEVQVKAGTEIHCVDWLGAVDLSGEFIRLFMNNLAKREGEQQEEV